MLLGLFMTAGVAATPPAWGAAGGTAIVTANPKSSPVPARPGSWAGVSSAGAGHGTDRLLR